MVLCCFDTEENESVKEKLVFPVYFYIWEYALKSSFLPWSEISWKRPDNKILCDFLCILQLFIYLSLGGQLVLSLGVPQPSLTLITRSELIFPAMGFSAEIATEDNPVEGVGHWHLLPGRGHLLGDMVSLPAAEHSAPCWRAQFYLGLLAGFSWQGIRLRWQPAPRL